MKRKTFVLMMFVIVLFLCANFIVGAQDAEETVSTEMKIPTTSNLLSTLEQFKEEGEFTNQGAPHALKAHLIALGHFENMGDKEKATKHMEGFHVLLDHQLAENFISEQAYSALKSQADDVLEIWNSLVVVYDGHPNAVVVLEAHADETTQQTAEILVEYVQKSTGIALPIVTVDELSDDEPAETQIYIGPEFNVDPHIDQELDDMDPHGFIIHPHDNHLIIVGPTVWGTRNGVYEFLERYVDIRWLLPGDDWVDVPQSSQLLIPKEDVIEEPDFTFRQISPTYVDPEVPGERQELGVWAQRNKLQGSYNEPFKRSHNLFVLFAPEKFVESNPEFYPNGSTASPWQPCFTAEGTIDAAVSEIVAFFNENPQEVSYSLAVNDNSNYCEADPDHPDYPNRLNSIDLVDMSDIYYRWVNEVAERVSEVHPDKWFGVLAYQNVHDTPSFPLHPRVVPFLTKDRLTWIDDEMKAEGHQRMEDWNEVASQLGWYDYLYGIFFATPRVYPHLIAENLRYAKENNVRGFMPDTFSNAGDGPKAWITAQLQWDTEQDVDALLNEWYERAVGPEAAPYLAAYYELWEHFWTARIKDSTYFNLWKGHTYLEISDPSYLVMVTDEDIAESRRLMNLVVENAQTDEQKERARQLSLMFEYYDASMTSYPRPSDPPKDEAAALEVLDNLENNVQLAEKRLDLIEEFDQYPAVKFPLKRITTWSGWDPFGFWNIISYMAEYESDGGAVHETIQAYAEGEPSKRRDVSRLLMEVNRGLETTLTENPSFEEGDTDADAWEKWIKSTGQMMRTEGVAYSGNSSLLVENLERGGPHQTFDINAGLIAAQVKYYTPPNTSNGIIEIQMNVKNASGRNIATIRSNVANLSDTVGEWASIGALGDIPTVINNSEPTQVQVVININNAEGTQVYLDDMVVYQLEDKNLVSNPGFESGGTIPSGWYIQSAANWARVQDEVRSGQYAVTLFPGPIGSSDISTRTPITVTPGVTYQVSFWAKNSSTDGGSFGIRRGDANNRMIDYIWQEVDRDSDWTLYSFTFEATENTHQISIYLRLEEGAGGQIWFDDIAVQQIENKNIVPNSGFELGGTIPSGWYIQSAANWARVQDEVRSGQYAVTLFPGPTGTSDISTRTPIPVNPGETYRVRFWAKNSSSDGGSFGIRRGDANNRMIDYIWQEVDRDSDWKMHTFTFEATENTHQIGIYLRLEEGAGGQIWFDDIHMEQI